MAFDQITTDPGVLGGSLHPWSAGAGGDRSGVVAAGMTVKEIVADFPYLEPDDIAESDIVRRALWAYLA